jgi:hypothetical protein
MATKFDDYISEVEERAKAGGPEALARWDAFNAHYAMAREVRELRKERHLTQKQARRRLRHQPGRDFADRARPDQPDRQHAYGTTGAAGCPRRSSPAREARPGARVGGVSAAAASGLLIARLLVAVARRAQPDASGAGSGGHRAATRSVV